MMITNTKKRIPTANVRFEMTFSEPLSFVLANKFNPPLPVKALEIPSDFPLCNKERIINAADTIINKISNISNSPFLSQLIISIDTKTCKQNRIN